MIQGNCTITDRLHNWLQTNRKNLQLDVKKSGCSGNEVTFTLTDQTDLRPWVQYSNCLYRLIDQGLVLEVDYLDTPLFQGVHINVRNKDKCGCGKSFN